MKRSDLVGARGNDEVTIRLVALAVRRYVPTLSEVVVDDLPLTRGHSVQRDRAIEPEGFLRGFVSLTLERFLAASAISLGVDDNPQAGTLAVARDDPLSEVLDGLDRLPTAPDKQPHVLSIEGAEDRLVLKLDLNLGLEAEGAYNRLEQLGDRLLG